jgi:hypothetical protein
VEIYAALLHIVGSHRSRTWRLVSQWGVFELSFSRNISLVLLTAVLAPTLRAAPPDADSTDQQFFDRRVAPLLAAHCLDCHGSGEPKGGLDLSRRTGLERGGETGASVDRDEPLRSLLWRRVEASEMPPERALSREDRQVIKEWLQRGAGWGSGPIDPFRYTSTKRAGYDWWSLQPLNDPEPPAIDDGWVLNNIDRFVAAGRKRFGLSPSPRADPRTLVRRAYYDLIGLPAAPEVIDRFAKDPSQARWLQLIGRATGSM